MNFLYLDEVDSTNLYGKRNLDSLPDKTIIVAKHQTAGRGRLNRSWLDLGDENIFASIILKPCINFDDRFANLTQYLSVILCKTFETYGLIPQIKWPNDVLINGKKISGILSETVMQGNNFKGLVLGFGINVSADFEDVKKVTDKEVTSLFLEIGKKIDCNDFLNNLLNAFFQDYNTFLERGFEFIKHDYLAHAMFIDKEVAVQIFDETKSGIVKSVDDNGALVLEKDNEQFVLTIGDIL